MKTEITDIPSLLHEAQLVDLEWQKELARLCLGFQCLRRNVDGTEIDDPTVTLVLSGVSGLAAYYSSAAVEGKASDLVVDEPLSEAALSNWSLAPTEVRFHINSPHQAFDMETACRTDWFVPLSCDRGSREYDIHLVLEPRRYAAEVPEIGVFIRCDALDAAAGGVPLDIDEWGRQFSAWWRGWEQHWADESDSEEAAEPPRLEDTFIPAGEVGDTDLTYRPPDEPPVLLDPSDVPEDIIRPVVAMHEAHFARDWIKMAECYPDLDMPTADRAGRLREMYEGCDFGNWIYVRHVDSWWREGPRACVAIRGIQHSMPDEEDPALNSETVVTYALRRYGESWIIWTWSQGWPQYGSAPKDGQQRAWRAGWELEE